MTYATKLQDGSLRFRSCAGQRFSEVIVKNGTIIKASAGKSPTYYWDCMKKMDEAIWYMSYCPECLAELLEVLHKNNPSYEFAKSQLIERRNAIERRLNNMNRALYKLE